MAEGEVVRAEPVVVVEAEVLGFSREEEAEARALRREVEEVVVVAAKEG